MQKQVSKIIFEIANTKISSTIKLVTNLSRAKGGKISDTYLILLLFGQTAIFFRVMRK